MSLIIYELNKIIRKLVEYQFDRILFRFDIRTLIIFVFRVIIFLGWESRYLFILWRFRYQFWYFFCSFLIFSLLIYWFKNWINFNLRNFFFYFFMVCTNKKIIHVDGKGLAFIDIGLRMIVCLYLIIMCRLDNHHQCIFYW